MAKSGALSTSNQYVKYTIEIIQNSQDKVNNKSNVTVKVFFYRTNTGWTTYGNGTVYCKIDGKQYSASVSSSQGITNSGITLFTKTLYIKHDDKTGEKTLTCSAWIDIPSVVFSDEQSFSTKLTTIPRASTATVDDGTLNTSQKFKVTQNNTAFSHAITYKCGNATGTAVSKTTETAPPWTPPISLASQNTTGDKVTIDFTITTYNGDTTIGSNTFSAEYTMPSSVKPSCSIAVSDPTGYKTTYGGYVQGKSKFKVTVTGTPSYNSAIKSYSTTANGKTYDTATFTTAEINNSGSNTISATVKDARGRTGTKSTSVTVLEYYDPKMTISAVRCDDNFIENVEGNNFMVRISYNVAPLNDKNKFSITVKHRKSGDSTFTSEELTGPYQETYNTDITFMVSDIEPDSSYEIEVVLTDNFGSTIRAAIVSSAFTFLHFDGPTRDGTGKNKLNLIENESTLPVEGTDWSFENDIYTLLKTGSWVSLMYNVYNVSKGDVVRFNTVILDSGGMVQLYAAYEDSSQSSGIRTDNIATLTYIDGITASYFEYTAPDTPLIFAVEFMDNSGTKTKDIRFERPIVTINEKDMTYERFIIGCPPRLGIGKIAELDYGVDFGLKARFNSGFEYPVLRENSDFDTLLTPNFYIGANVATYKYVNCPITGGTFYLEIVAAGEDSYRQSVTTCSKEASVTYERFYHDGSWGPWRDVYHGQEVLYNNESGTTGTVTALKSLKNFAFIDIYYADNNNNQAGTVRVWSPYNKVIHFHSIEPGPSRTWIRRTSYTTTEYNLTPNVTDAGFVKMEGTTFPHTVGTNYIKITRIMGTR